jgi:hypothetical protein
VTAGLEETSVTFSCRGHPAIRGTHPKTLELTREQDISCRATCVVGVGAEVEPEDLAGFVGPLSITLHAGPHQEVVRARAEPMFRLQRSIVIRRSRYRSPDTFAIEADRGAGDLDRELVASLRHRDARLVVTVSGRRSVAAARGARLTVVVGLEAPPPALLALLESADLVLAERAVVRTLRGLTRMPVTIDDPDGLRRALHALEAGQRVVVMISSLVRGLGAASRLTEAAVASAVPLDFMGVPDEVRALLVSGLASEPPITIGRLTGDMNSFPSKPGVWWVPSRALEGLLAEGGRARVCVVLDPGRPLETAICGEAERVLERVGGSPSEDALLVVAPAVAPEGWPLEVEALLVSLLRRGLSVRLLAQALADLPGFNRRRAYAAVMGLRHRLEKEERGEGQETGGDEGGKATMRLR